MRHLPNRQSVSHFRILMFSSYFPPEYSGAALQAVTLAKQLRQMGHYIEFVTQRWTGLSAEDEFEGFRVSRLECGRGDKHRELRLWWNLYRFLQRRHRDFDFLHTHGAYYRNAIVGPLARTFKLKSLAKASLADNDLRDLGQTLTGRIHLAMLRRVDACIAISQDLEREFIKGGVSAERVHYLPNCVDTERLLPADLHERQALRKRLGLPLDKKIVLYMGVFDDRKNVSWLIREWLHAEGFGLNALLLAVGPQSREDPDGCFKDALTKSALPYPDLLRIEGEVTQVSDYYRAADLFIMPSKSEGLPNAVLEAMACGLPCVAANVSGTRELVADGRTGCLFDPDDVAGLRAALQHGLGPAAEALGLAGRSRAEQCFSIRQLANRYVDLYRSLICHRPGASAIFMMKLPFAKETRPSIQRFPNDFGNVDRIPEPLTNCGYLDSARRDSFMSLKTLLITELFLPTKGGTAILFDDDFRRLGGKNIHIMTANVTGALEFDQTHPNSIHRLELRRVPWVRPESLFMYAKLFLVSLWLTLSARLDIVFAGRALPEGLVAWAVARLTRRPVYIYAHGEELTGWGRGNKFRAMRFALRHADMVLANSDFTHDALLNLIGLTPERIAVVYPTVDATRFLPKLPSADLRRRLGLTDTQKVILSVGRLQRRKGFDNVIRSLPSLIANGFDVHYVLIGIGEDHDYLCQLAHDGGISERVHLLGLIDYEELPRWYSACDVFVTPNRDIDGDTEGFGIVFLEAAASAKPSLAGLAGGTGSAVIDGETGLRVDGDRVEAIVEGLTLLLRDTELAREMGQRGRERVLASFTPQRRAEQLRHFIDRN